MNQAYTQKWSSWRNCKVTTFSFSPWNNQSHIKWNYGIICIFNYPKESFSDYLILLRGILLAGKRHGIQLFKVLTYLNKPVRAGDVTVRPERCTEQQYALKCVCLSPRCCVLGGLFVWTWTIWFPMCAYRMRNVLTFAERALSLCQAVVHSVSFTEHTRRTNMSVINTT